MKKRHIALMIFFFAMWVILSMSSGRQGGSTFAADAQGTKAFYLLLEAEGLKPERFFYPFTELEKQGVKGVLFVITPGKPPGSAKELKAWVSAGNTLVLFGLQTYGMLHELDTASKDALNMLSVFRSEPESIDVACLDVPECVGVKAISRPQFSLKAPKDAQVISGLQRDARVFRRQVGAGEVWVFSGGEPISNQNIDLYDNLRLLYQLAASRDRVIFDEFHHGYIAPIAPERAGGYHSILLALCYLSVAAVIAALSRSIRFGPPAPEGPQESLASTDFAGVLGLLYSERGARSALRHYVGAWRSRIEKRFGISRRLPHDAMLTDLTQEGVISGQGAALLHEQLRRLEEPSAQQDGRLELAVSELEKLAAGRWNETAFNQERHQ